MKTDNKKPNVPLINVRGLCKSFSAIEDRHKTGPAPQSSGDPRIDVLKNLDFDLDEGETVAIVGASGIGKSTLLHIIGTLDRPDSGTVLFRNENVFLFNNSQLAKFRNESVGFVFQFHHLLPEFSALENAMIPGMIKGLSKQHAGEAAKEILIRVGLKNRLFHRVGELSGGEQQRVALARALVLKPAILLADEPTGNLDKKNSEQVHELFLELNQEYHMTMVVVTHNMELAAYMSRRVTIADGELRIEN
ncbi:ABC transporter ATP-binding protein [Desulfonema magnum]|uniref:Lipoprotein-releasing system, ATP-binding protein, LolD-like n=1 Tax=Desulfonema magnum TaxID=45655 RepID=A0A975GSN4_9BACT|nr:ABC transporter ATP-binding protein [Desulfonema magnum]QTA92235.1 Putative lipoprotein-releasing system, ATP-binding protein, LolD-like [Desulfonema magnum]